MFLVLRNRWYSWLKVAIDAQELKTRKDNTKLYFIHNKPSQIQLKLMILLEGKNCGSSSQPTIKWIQHKNSRYKNEDIMMQHKKAIQNGLRIMVSYSLRPIGSSGPTNPFFQGEGLTTTQCCIFSPSQLPKGPNIEGLFLRFVLVVLFISKFLVDPTIGSFQPQGVLVLVSV